MHDSVTVHINAAADDIWTLISDITQTGKYSPETFEAEWLDGAPGPVVGARFRGHVDRNGHGVMKYWTVCEVAESVPGKVFSFNVFGGNKVVNSWKYELAPSGEGTDVTESFALGGMAVLKLYWALFGWSRGSTNREGMRTTLERIKAVAEG